MHLLDIIFPPRADELVVRKISTDDFLSLVTPQLVPATRPATVTLLPFSDPRVRSTIHEAKYHGNERAFELLSLALVEYLRDADEPSRATLIIPTPLGAQRRRERGFNQVEEVAKRTQKILGGSVATSLLTRIRETPSQVSLAREKREENMRGAFATPHALDPRTTYILLDDVLTTGATLQAASDALLAAGAVTTIPIALAH